MSIYTQHHSVLSEECFDFLQNVENGNKYFADLTFGAGGHTSLLLERLSGSRVLACDQDPDALDHGRLLLEKKQWQERLKLFDTNFVDFPQVANKELKEKNLQGFQGILLDLGVSSHHFDSAERGFSFRHEGPLDMRMNPREEILTAADILNQYSQDDLQTIFSDYGEEKFSRRIAEKIVEVRRQKPFERTKDLEDLVFHCYPKKWRHGRVHPSTRVFQALRIVVNRELDVLSDIIDKLPSFLIPGGRLLVISFHSLEDRIVKQAFKKFADRNSELPYRTLTKKPIVPTEQEKRQNARARSAKLRILERIVENPEK